MAERRTSRVKRLRELTTEVDRLKIELKKSRAAEIQVEAVIADVDKISTDMTTLEYKAKVMFAIRNGSR